MNYKKYKYTLGLLALLFLPFGQMTQAQSLNEFEKKVTKFTLDNGLTFVVIDRPVAPVVSMETYVDVGSANEPVGYSGIAHVFEHMAFKGTSKIGTKNWSKEKKVLQKEDDTYQKWLTEKFSTNPDSARMDKLWKQFKDLQKDAEGYVQNNEFSQVIDRNGGAGLNASTAADRTEFHYSLPENRLELWFNLESARFKDPVFREFYKEKKVIKEERRMRTDSSPVGRLIESFLATAYNTHPYHHPTIGWFSDITATTMQDARKFYKKYYVPSNITLAIAGDVDVKQIKKWAKQYFGDIKKSPAPPPIHTHEPDQRGMRTVSLTGQTQPILIMGYHTVAQDNPDADALQLLSSILSGGRTSILYQKLVQDQQLALQVQAFNGFPGDKLQSMFLMLGVPNSGVSNDSLQTAILNQVEKVKNGTITEEALQRAKTKARANLVRSLDSNSGLALALARAEAQQGDWRKVFTHIDDLKNVTLDDLQRVAQKYLVKDNLTIGTIAPNKKKMEASDAESK